MNLTFLYFLGLVILSIVVSKLPDCQQHNGFIILSIGIILYAVLASLIKLANPNK